MTASKQLTGLDIPCPVCGAQPGNLCDAKSTTEHVARRRRAAGLNAERAVK